MYTPTPTKPVSALIKTDPTRRRLQKSKTLIGKSHRRPLYFDGRFLASSDLVHDQSDFLARQADLARLSRYGVIDGLMVRPDEANSARSFVIEPGAGMTPLGQMVLLSQPLAVDLADAPTIQRLNRVFGLDGMPQEPHRNQSGLFIIALRPAEFTARPIGSYPTHLDDERKVNDADIVEAAAVTLIPYDIYRTGSDLNAQRAAAAREIFLNASLGQLPRQVLPLALVALDRGVIRWIDPFLARRQVGTMFDPMSDLNLTSYADREAYFWQYDQHLRDVISTAGLRLASAEHFRALPPCGRLPAATINATTFSQIYFPSEANVELSIIPEDELPVMIQESMTLPPIDLAGPRQQRQSVSVLVLIPLPRDQFRRVRHDLNNHLTRPAHTTTPETMMMNRPLSTHLWQKWQTATKPASLTKADIWRSSLANVKPTVDGHRLLDMLWYVRCRNLHVKTDVVGLPYQESTRANKRIHTIKPHTKAFVKMTTSF